MSGVLGTNAYKNYFDNPKSFTQGYITASMPAGSVFGTLGSSFIADRFSRKVAIQVSCLLWILGSWYVLFSDEGFGAGVLIGVCSFQSGSNGIAMLCVGRFISGLGVGAASAIVPVYQAEIAPRDKRGRMIALQQWAITWGILIQFYVQYGASFADGGQSNPAQGSAAFRIPWGLQMIPAFALAIGMVWLPHSPRWLAAQDRWEEAITVLARLHAGGDLKDPRVLAQYREIEEALRFEKEARAAGWAALAEKKMAYRVFLGMSVQFWGELCGMNVMMYYIVCKLSVWAYGYGWSRLTVCRYHGECQHRHPSTYGIHTVRYQHGIDFTRDYLSRSMGSSSSPPSGRIGNGDLSLRFGRSAGWFWQTSERPKLRSVSTNMRDGPH